MKKERFPMRDLQVDDERIKRLERLCDMLLDRKPVKEFWDAEAQRPASEVTPAEVMYLVDYMIEKQSDMEALKPAVSKLVNLFSTSLIRHKDSYSPKFEFEQVLYEENSRISAQLSDLRELVTEQKDLPHMDSERLEEHLSTLSAVIEHYVDLENILFSYAEQYITESRCVQLMWSIHDDVRATIKKLLVYTQDSSVLERKELNILLGKLFFDIGNMVFREEHILLPSITPLIPEHVWEKMMNAKEGREMNPTSTTNESVQLPTGYLTAQQLIQIFSTIPVDLTLVDRDDKVVFFNTPEKRIFPRSTAVIGRNVKNCHPPESMHVVENILKAFRNKERTKAEFYIHVKDYYVYIQYVALYDEKGEYDGVLEILQEISDIQKISGDKRLLDWD
jgi:PAS domain S-box-containing protein